MPSPRRDLTEGERMRVRQTVACRDTDALPKVDGAGEVLERDGLVLQRMHNGLLIEEGCYYGPWMTEIIRDLRGHHEPQEEVVFHEILERLAAGSDRKAPVIVELGSHWAYYSMWFLTRFPAGRAFCLEPDAAYLNGGMRNFALNGLSGTFLRGAIGDPPGGSWDFQQESDGAWAVAPLYDLELLLEEWDLDHVDILMVDIQGAESELLERALPLLRQGRVSYLVVSTHHHSISGSALTHQHARDLLSGAGANLLADHTVGESCSGDGLVAASFEAGDAGDPIAISRVRARDSLFGELEYDLANVYRDLSAAQLEVAGLRSQRLQADAVHLELMREREARSTAEARLSDVLGSRSWRMTSPFRTSLARLGARRSSPHRAADHR